MLVMKYFEDVENFRFLAQSSVAIGEACLFQIAHKKFFLEYFDERRGSTSIQGKFEGRIFSTLVISEVHVRYSR